MSAITRNCGPAPTAFIILPLVSAFFVDLVNVGAIMRMIGRICRLKKTRKARQNILRPFGAQAFDVCLAQVFKFDIRVCHPLRLPLLLRALPIQASSTAR